MLTFIQYLIEAREDTIAQQQGKKIMYAFAYDESPMSQQERDNMTPIKLTKMFAKVNQKYVQWITNQYVNYKFDIMDLNIIDHALTEFDRVKSQLESKNLNDYTLSSLRDAIDPFEGQEILSGKQSKKSLKNQGADKVIDNDNVILYKVNTEQAACLLGSHTKWCTAAKYDNKFKSYNDRGQLYILIDKQSNEKFQIHLETGEIKNDEDDRMHFDFLSQDYPNVLQYFITDNPQGIKSLVATQIADGNYSLIRILGSNILLDVVKEQSAIWLVDIPKKYRTKEICLACYEKRATDYGLFPDEFKTLALSLDCVKRILKEMPNANWGSLVPIKHFDVIQEYFKITTKLKKLRNSFNHNIKFIQMISSHIKKAQDENNVEKLEQFQDVIQMINNYKQENKQTRQESNELLTKLKQIKQQVRDDS